LLQDTPLAKAQENRTPNPKLAKHAQRVGYGPVLNDEPILEVADGDSVERDPSAITRPLDHEARDDAIAVYRLILDFDAELRKYGLVHLDGLCGSFEARDFEIIHMVYE
jgi:hypothetical protein